MIKTFQSLVLIGVSALLGQSMLVGCTSEEKKPQEFYTSGNKEADQRAEQRMAREQQLKDTKDTKASAEQKLTEKLNKTLYDRLGAEEGLRRIVEDFTARVMADPRVNWDRKGVKAGTFFHPRKSLEWSATPEHVAALKEHLVEFLCVATGGPSKYTGREMGEVHKGMHITNPEFDAAVGDLKASLDKITIPLKEQKELLAVIETTRPQVVTDR